MSVVTTADELLDSAKSHVQDAMEDLSKIVIDGTWGTDNFTPEFMDAMTRALFRLSIVRKLLGG